MRFDLPISLETKNWRKKLKQTKNINPQLSLLASCREYIGSWDFYALVAVFFRFCPEKNSVLCIILIQTSITMRGLVCLYLSIFFFLVLLGEYLNESFENLIEMLNVKYFMLSCYKKLEYRDWIEYIQVLFYVTILAAHLVISCKCESRVLKWVVYWVSILCKLWLNADTFQWINSNTL